MLARLARQLNAALVAAPLLASGPTLAAEKVARPSIDSVSVDPELTAITILGQGFGPGAVKVRLGGQELQMLTNDGTAVAARLRGVRPGKYPLVLTTAAGRSATFVATLDGSPQPPPAPKNDAAKPAPPEGPGIDAATASPDLSAIAITGRGFGQGFPTITLGGEPLQPLTNDGTSISARLRPGLRPGTYPLVLTWPDGRSAALEVSIGK